MGFRKDVREIRRELLYATSLYEDGHESTVVVTILRVRDLVNRTLNHLAEGKEQNVDSDEVD